MALDATLYTATATATGGRAGTAATDDSRLSVSLSTPKGLGGDDGPGTNPEQLFAAGYSACFIGAMKAVAGRMGKRLPAEVSITSVLAASLGTSVCCSRLHWAVSCSHAGNWPRPSRVALAELPYRSRQTARGPDRQSMRGREPLQ